MANFINILVVARSNLGNINSSPFPGVVFFFFFSYSLVLVQWRQKKLTDSSGSLGVFRLDCFVSPGKAE